MTEWDQRGKDEPGLNPLDIRGLVQLLDHTKQEGGGGQHHSDVHSDAGVEEVWQLEEGCGVSYEQRGKERHHSFSYQTYFEDNVENNFLLVCLGKFWRFWVICDILGQFLAFFNLCLSKHQIRLINSQNYIADLKHIS